MLSIIVYGRNDSHGYNLHKRAALSFNCLAQVLDDDDDEIVFVDYNTPPEMPTFIEAIRDTLTDEAIRRMRVIRVPASIHAERFAARTHLPALEPIARNAGLRRTNPANRWILSTNTDMLFVPTQSRSLSDIVGSLDDGYYALPRFNLPEALWESLDRKDPAEALERAADWGTSLHLDEVVTSYPWMLFDAPGDFQLVLRDRLLEMRGFDEEMLLGWHVDSNLCKRHWLGYGAPNDLRHELRGYHCDHTRVPGVFHSRERVSNDLERFSHSVDRPDLPEQAETWGLADVALEEVDLRASVAAALPEALRTVLPEHSGAPPTVDGRTAFALFCYPAEHVLPFVARALATLSRSQPVAYVGENPELVEPLARLLTELAFSTPLLVADGSLHDFGAVPGVLVTNVADVVRRAEAVIFDFGLPSTLAYDAEPILVSQWPYATLQGLGQVLSQLDALVQIDTSGSHDARPLRMYV
ncbi:MAG: hypothetical protein MUP97_15135, partial [Acidimicrobiia bacterium]|nr:hypothetical protein [Acidimicrobiia bacterium]